MAGRIKGITVEIGGDTVGLDKALGEVNKKSRDLQNELRGVEKLLKLDPKNTELLAQKQKLLAESVANTRGKLDSLKEAEKQVQKQFKKGEVSEEQYRALQREIIATEQKLKGLETQTKKNAKSFDMNSKAMQGLNTAANTALAGVTAVATGLVATSQGTQELREDMAKLENNAINAGAGVEETEQALKRLNTISSETDSNIEALSNLLEAGFTDNNGMNEVLDSLSGAVLKFPDTLKIEGLADGLQETLATGKSVGPFAELLERMGLDLEEFDTGLAGCTTSAEKQQYVLEVLSKTGLADANEQYQKNNQSLIESKNAQYDLQQSMADLGEVAEPIITTVTEKITKLVKWVTKNKKASLALLGAVTALAIGFKAFMIITTITTAFKSYRTATAAAAVGQAQLNTAMSLNPIAIVVIAITALIAAIVYLWNTNEDFRNFITECWENIKTVVQTVVDEIINFFTVTLPTAFQSFLDWMNTFFITDWTTKFGMLGLIINYFRDGIKAHFTAISNIFQNLIAFVKNVFTGNWSAAWQNVVDIFGNIFNLIKDLAMAPINFVTGLIDGVVESVKNALEWLTKLGKKRDEADEDEDEERSGGRGSKKMRMMATGGVLSHGEAIVAEAGPELIQMINGRAVVTPLTKSATNTEVNTAAQKGGKAGDVTVNVYSPKALTAPETARQFKRAQRQLALGV